MDPNLQPPAPQGNPYDYILNAPTNNRRRNLFGGGGNKTVLSVLFVVIVIFLVIVLIVVFNSLTKKDYGEYIKLTQQQSEIIRVADIGILKARSPSTKAYAQTIKTVTSSEQSDTLAFLKKKNQAVGVKQLASLKDTSTDKKLTSAESSSTYDDTFVGTLNGLIITYQKSIKTATAAPSGSSEKSLATTLQTNAKVIANAK